MPKPDWLTLDALPLLIGVVGLSLLAFVTWRRYQKIAPQLPRDERRAIVMEQIASFGFYVSLVVAFTAEDSIRARFGETWLGTAAYFLLIAAGLTGWITAAGHLQRVRQRRAENNPLAAPADKLKLTEEERRVGLRLNMVLLLGAVALIAPLLVALFLVDLRSQVALIGLFVHVTLCLGLVGFVFAGRWPGKIRKSATVVIDAPQAAVWEMIHIRACASNWNPSVRGIEAVPGFPKTFDIRHYNLDPCSVCGLTLSPGTPGTDVRVKILDEQAPALLCVHALQHGRLPGGKAMLKWEEERFSLRALGPQQTEIAAESTAHQPTVLFAIILLLGDACGEQLRTIKGLLEGKPSGTIFEASAARVDAQRKAEKFCGCPAPAVQEQVWTA